MLFAQSRIGDAKRLVVRVALAIAVIVALIAAAGGPRREAIGGQSHGAGAIAVAHLSAAVDDQERRPADAADRDLVQETSAERGPLDDAVLASAGGVAVAIDVSKTRHLGADHELPGSAAQKPPFEPPRA